MYIFRYHGTLNVIIMTLRRTALVRRLDIVPTVDALKGVRLSGVAADRQIGQDGFRGGRERKEREGKGKKGKEGRKGREGRKGEKRHKVLVV